MNSLHLFSLSKTFAHNKQTTPVLCDITIKFLQGNLYCITGASGSGKSTLLHLIAGLDKPTSGSVVFNSTDIALLDSDKHSVYLNRSLGLVFQSAYLIKELSVVENVMLPGLIHNKCVTDVEKKALALLEKVGLLEKAHAFPGELSGGQQQRVALARALINEPAFLIADEPTGNLDVATGRAIIDLIIECHQEWGMGVIMSSHDSYVVEKMKIVFELRHGTLIHKNNNDISCYPQKKFLQKQYK